MGCAGTLRNRFILAQSGGRGEELAEGGQAAGIVGAFIETLLQEMFHQWLQADGLVSTGSAPAA